MRPRFVSGPLIREVVNNVLLEWSEEVPEFEIYRKVLTRVGAPVYDAYQIDMGQGWEARENANLQPNPETVHKKKADRLSKEEYLLLLPPHLATAHHQGDIHIHTLEYFGTRPFCQDWDLRYFFYYGLLPDGTGFRSSVAGPAKHPEVAVLHSVKVLAAGQTNFSGGQGFMYYTLFLAPYMRGLKYEEVKQLAQMMFYELTQTYVTRGGQLVFSNIQLPMGVPKIWENVPIAEAGSGRMSMVTMRRRFKPSSGPSQRLPMRVTIGVSPSTSRRMSITSAQSSSNPNTTTYGFWFTRPSRSMAYPTSTTCSQPIGDMGRGSAATSAAPTSSPPPPSLIQRLRRSSTSRMGCTSASADGRLSA